MRLDPLPVAGIRLEGKEVLDIILTANAAAGHRRRSWGESVPFRNYKQQQEEISSKEGKA